MKIKGTSNFKSRQLEADEFLDRDIRHMCHQVEWMASEYSMEALEVARRIMADETVNPRVRLVAVKAIWERGLGMPRQQVSVDVSSKDPSLMTTRELLDALDRIRASATGSGEPSESVN